VLELVATVWLFALAATSVLFVGVVVAQAVSRRLRTAARTVQQVAQDAAPAAAQPAGPAARAA
jgi:hypothetical protein